MAGALAACSSGGGDREAEQQTTVAVGRGSTATPQLPGGATVTVPASAPWTAPSLTFSATSLGAVALGMSQALASKAAGMALEAVGDGVLTASRLPPGSAYLYFTGGCIGAMERPGRTQQVSANGIGLGDSGSKIVRVYGSTAQYMPAPGFGRTPASGYVVRVGAQRLAFVLSDGPTSTIVGIRLGPADLTPSDCGG